MNERVLVTGGTGFVGRALVSFLKSHGMVVLPLGGASDLPSASGVTSLDIADDTALRRILRTFKPGIVIHLAAVSSVPSSWREPAETFRVNVLGTLTLLTALKEELPNALLLSFGSGEEYGPQGTEQCVEQGPTTPDNPYGVSKLAQGLLVAQWARTYHLRAIHIRAFNLIGPGQSTAYVLSDWSAQIAEIERGQREATIHVGNTNIARDFLDIRDACSAVYGLLSSTTHWSVYNLCSGIATPLHELLRLLCEQSTVHITVHKDPARLRPTDIPALVGNPRHLIEATGWHPTYSLARTVRDTLQFWRDRPDG